VHAAVSEAARRALAGEGPTRNEVSVFRLQSHSTDDDQRAYRVADELAAEALKDPIPRLRADLTGRGWLTAQADAELINAVTEEVESATEDAERAPDPDPSTLTLHVYADA